MFMDADSVVCVFVLCIVVVFLCVDHALHFVVSSLGVVPLCCFVVLFMCGVSLCCFFVVFRCVVSVC